MSLKSNKSAKKCKQFYFFLCRTFYCIIACKLLDKSSRIEGSQKYGFDDLGYRDKAVCMYITQVLNRKNIGVEEVPQQQ